MSVLELEGISKTYDIDPPIVVLSGLELAVAPGEKVAIFGESGAGKSTLLNILGLLDTASSGEYRLAGIDAMHLSAKQTDLVRSEYIGFVFQDFHILGHRTVAENLDIKLAISKIPRSERESFISSTLDRVGLSHRKNSLGRLLSGGEKQRLAIARAIMTEPALLLADEPTGNLDSRHAQAVLDLFDEQAKKGSAVVIITHDDRIARWAERVLVLRDGRLHE